MECEICGKKFESEESLNQHSTAKHPIGEKKKLNFRKYGIFGMLILIVIFSVFSVSSYMKKPGEYDDFAKCLTNEGVIIYGNDFCSYTSQQLNLFGKSKQYLDYVKCIDNKELCDNKGIKVTPTWEIDGKMYAQVHGLDKLAKLSGCGGES